VSRPSPRNEIQQQRRIRRKQHPKQIGFIIGVRTVVAVTPQSKCMVSLAILDVFVTDSFYDFLVYCPLFALVSHMTVHGQLSSPSIFGGTFAADARTAPGSRKPKICHFTMFLSPFDKHQ
jgi:hypothetical protein